MKENPTIYLSDSDYQALSLLLRAIKVPQGTALTLKDELARAIVLGDSEVPPDSVGISSEVDLEDLDEGAIETYSVVLPAQANPDANRVSILAPLGIALLGVRAGDRFEWNTPGGRRRLRAVKVSRKPVEAVTHGPYSLR